MNRQPWFFLIIVVIVVTSVHGCALLAEPTEQPPVWAADTTEAESVGAFCLSEADIPPSLEIRNDDAQWLCGDKSPEPPREYDVGVVAAGVRECYPGDEPPVAGDDIWVSVEGDDRHPGDAPTRALRTLGEALCRAQPGQTIHLLPGTYQEGVVIGALVNGDQAPLTIRGEGSDAGDVVLDGGYWRSFGIGFVETNNVLVENLTVQHYTDAGIYALSSEGVHIKDVVAFENGRCSVDPDAEGEGFGVNLVGVKGMLVEGSRFDHNGPLLAPMLCGEVLGTGINTFEASGIIRNNEIVRTRGGGMLVEKSVGPVRVEGNLVTRNFFLAVDNYWDAGIWIDESVDVLVRQNQFIANWGGAGVMVSDEERAYPAASKQITITDNVLTDNFAGVLVWGFGECPPPDDVITNWSRLTVENEFSRNTFNGQPRPVWCDPDFVGGDVPAPRDSQERLYTPLVFRK